MSHYSKRLVRTSDLESEVRCSQCDKLLAKIDVREGALTIKCLRCGELNSILCSEEVLIVIMGLEGTILYINNAVVEVTGYTVSEILGNKPSLWNSHMSEDFYIKMWNRIKDDKQPFRGIVTNRRKDGSLYEATLHISPVFDARKDIGMLVAVEVVLKSNSLTALKP